MCVKCTSLRTGWFISLAALPQTDMGVARTSGCFKLNIKHATSDGYFVRRRNACEQLALTA